MYEEFSHLKEIKDSKNPFSKLYEFDDGSQCYIEPLFYSYIKNFETIFPDKLPLVIDEIEKITKKNKQVIFTGMDEEFEDEPVTKKEGLIILTLTDILDRIGIYIDNKSRGSDYGD